MSVNIPNYKQRQTMLSLAYLAYAGEQITTPDPEQTIAGYINKAMPQITPLMAPNDTWALVWGPITYTVPGALYQDNLMFVVQNQNDTSQYAVAVRGTNFVSQLDWLMEDFDIMQQMNWPPGASTSSPAGAMISESTSIDLQILFAMEGATDNGQTMQLIPFLQSQASQPINVCVTGHSLGGCVAGTLALYLKANQSTWDGSGKSIVSAITFAAPTAGNATFATYTNSVFEGGPYPPNWDSSLGSTFDAVRCDYDIAPQAWIASQLAQGTSPNVTSPLFSTYGSNLNFANLDLGSALAWNYIVQNFLPLVAAYFSKQNYQQPVVNTSTNPQLSGLYNISFAPASADLMDYVESFVQQAAWQHGNSYPTVLNVPELLNPAIIPRT